MDENALLGRVVWNLLPTPTATPYGSNQSDSPGAAVRPSLDGVTQRLLPTPLVGSTNPAERFGDYADAVSRWQPIIGRPAPDPTIDGRLSPLFVEWMMGLPAGWVTDVPGLKRAQQLKALGNGVVPQQAAAAIHHMITALGGEAA